MERILKLAILVVVLWAGYHYGRPYLEGVMGDIGGSGASGGGEAGDCIRMVERASDHFAGILRETTPPVDLERWRSSLAMSQGRLGQARTSCSCSGDACDLARSAIREIDGLMSSWDMSLSSNSSPPLNSARAFESIDSLLAQAKSAAR